MEPNHAQPGLIKLFLGCMFSGKTSSLIDMYTDGATCLAIKPLVDTRGNTGHITSHNGAFIPAIVVAKLMPVPSYILPNRGGRVLIDEGQFFEDLAEGCERFSRCGINVYVAALSGTAENQPWKSVSYLVPHADTIVHCKSAQCSICKNAEAPFTAIRQDVKKDSEILIGGSETYYPVCRACKFGSSM